jgi:aminoglycoside 6'-N-acetyltransferase I
LVVARVGSEIIGQAAAILHRHPDKATQLYIDELGVTPSYRGQGIARQLLEELLAWGRELGCAVAWLGTEEDNEPAKAVYKIYAVPQPFLMYEWELERNP